MKHPFYLHLSRRESQIMDVLYALGEGSVEDVRERLEDEVSYDSVRLTLRALERKGHVRHRDDGVRFIYAPATELEEAKRSIVTHVLTTFFGGSAPQAVATLLDVARVSPDEIAEITRQIEEMERDDP